MSRTYRHNKNNSLLLIGKKLKPYVGIGKQRYKFKAEACRGTGITKLGKLVAKNANRGLKKSIRQEIKSSIKKELDNYYD